MVLWIMPQLSLFETTIESLKIPVADNSSTFQENLALPVHRWFRYSAGFSARWVRELISAQLSKGASRILDPFAGSATVLLEAQFAGACSIGIEAHPLVARIARTKLLWDSKDSDFKLFAERVLDRASNCSVAERCEPPLLQKCYPAEILIRLRALHETLVNLSDGSASSELSWLALISILRQCSPVGTAQWQYVLPSKKKAKVLDPFRAFHLKVCQMTEDMRVRQSLPSGPRPIIYQEDARQCPSVASGWAQLVITSPPYANNYDYADSTRLEMTFLGEIRSWGDLQDAVRKHLIRSCSQHVSRISSQTTELISDSLLAPIRNELTIACSKLEEEREHHGGKKTYHTMVAAYFKDMARVFDTLRRITAAGALACFVIGDSAPYGVHIPVDRWLGELAISSGFRSYRFEKTRERNIKWKNRKHRVPLHEGRLWIEG